MKISYLITVHNEGEYLEGLLSSLILPTSLSGDEIVILDDYSTDPVTIDILTNAVTNHTHVSVHQHNLNGDFAAHKNAGNALCKGEFIFQLDADELPPGELIRHIHSIVTDSKADMIAVPRINIVDGLTPNDINRWGWTVDHRNWVMFPDYQTRIYRNDPRIKWSGTVHERIVGYNTLSQLPATELWSIVHHKDITRQREQNQLYETMSQ